VGVGTGAVVTGAVVAGAGVTGAGVTGAGVTGAGVTGAGVTGASVTGAGVTGAGVGCEVGGVPGGGVDPSQMVKVSELSKIPSRSNLTPSRMTEYDPDPKPQQIPSPYASSIAKVQVSAETHLLI